jgi:hypothetical protein
MKRETGRTRLESVIRIGLSLSVLIFVAAPAAHAEDDEYSGPGGSCTEVTTESHRIKLVEGEGDWVIWGVEQDVEIAEINGPGSVILRNFGNVKIARKSGGGSLTVCDDIKSIEIIKIDGPGSAFLRNRGYKKIHRKTGDGNIFFRVAPPILAHKMEGAGRIIRSSGDSDGTARQCASPEILR